MLLSELEEETKEIEFLPSAIAVAGSAGNTQISTKNSTASNTKLSNPLLPTTDQISNGSNTEETDSKPVRRHKYPLITHTSKTNLSKPSKYYNLYCCLLLANVILIGSVLDLVLFANTYTSDAIAILFIIIGLILNVHTIWKFCGNRICPMMFKHENTLVFDDYEQTIYIHWNGLIKQSTIKYSEFARLYIDEVTTENSKRYAIVYIATNAKHYRFNKFICGNVEKAKEFVKSVNNWFKVERHKQKKKRRNSFVKISLAKETAMIEEKQQTNEDIYLQNKTELTKLIKKLKYKSFAEKDIENGGKLKAFFDSKYKDKMIAEYVNLKKELEMKRNDKSVKELDKVVLGNETKYISEALVLQFETLDQLIEKRKMDKLQFMIKENRSKKYF